MNSINPTKIIAPVQANPLIKKAPGESDTNVPIMSSKQANPINNKKNILIK